LFTSREKHVQLPPFRLGREEASLLDEIIRGISHSRNHDHERSMLGCLHHPVCHGTDSFRALQRAAAILADKK
jgi:hypothetical protein